VRIVVGALDEADAEALFLSRARAAHPEFSPGQGEEIRNLVRFLDGHPLALELAAERATTMNAAEIHRGFMLTQSLQAGSMTPPRIVDSALIWAWEVLSDVERRALACFSTFRGGFTLAAAEAILPLPPGAPWVGILIHSLCEHGLIEIGTSYRGSERTRYHLLDSVLDFASARLMESPAQQEQIRRAHLKFYAGLGRHEVLGSSFSFAAPALHTRLVEEQGNLRLALEAGLALEEPDLATYAALALGTLYSSSGPFQLGCELLRSVLAANPSDPELKAAAWSKLAKLLTWRSQVEAKEAIAQARRAAKASGNPSVLADVVLADAMGCIERGDNESAETAALEGLALCEKNKLLLLELVALNCLCIIYRKRSDFQRALEVGKRGLEAAERAREFGRHAVLSNSLACVELQLGNPDRAAPLFEKSLSYQEKNHETHALAHTVGNLALVYLMQGNYDGARKFYQRSWETHHSIGQQKGETLAEGNLGLAELEAGELERAILLLRGAVARAEEFKLSSADGAFRSGLGEELGRLGDFEGARESFQIAQELLEASADPGELALLQARRGLVALSEKKTGAAQTLMKQAEREAKRLCLSPVSDLGRALLRLRVAFALS